MEKRLRNIQLGLTGSGRLALPTEVGLATGSHTLAQWMAKEFNHNFDEYDKAIDAVYNETHIGGSQYHHILDGQHTIWGAYEAVKDVKTDDSFLTEILQAGEHLLRDLASVSGINPFLSPEQFNSLAQVAQHFSIPKWFLADALTVNGPELLSGMLGIVASLMMGNKPDPSRLSMLSGGYLISSIAFSNPILLPIAVGGVIYANRHMDNKKTLLLEAGKGAVVSGGALLVGAMVGGPVWLSCIAAVAAALSIRYMLEKPEKTFHKMSELIKPASSLIRKVTLHLS